eukprot:TRINITY_DN16303_c0_g1_i2.p1 TRINITY_DN16303_c0_g1~~TRINITY_DN16303_c0_g1_i2.p1  ORF type:complete len:236 (+),score=37.21 TRINITY_DN16303_c0_g1_i2:77-784(+)
MPPLASSTMQQHQRQPLGAYGEAAAGKTRAERHAASLLSGGVSDGRERLYGAIRDYRRWEGKAEEERLSRRRRVSCLPALRAWLVPWVAFLLSFAVASSYIHYAAPIALRIVAGLALLASSVCGLRAATALRTGDDWFGAAYMAVAIALFTALGALCGDWTFWSTTQQLYQLEHMAVHSNVNAAAVSQSAGQNAAGSVWQDVGTFYFTGDTVIDVNRSSSFRALGNVATPDLHRR